MKDSLAPIIDFDKKNNKEGPKFKAFDNVRISKYKNVFAKDYVSNWSEEVFVDKFFVDFCDKLYVKWKGYDSFCNSWIYKKILLYKNELFFHLIVIVKIEEVEVDLCNYATKSDLKNSIRG